MQSEGKTRCFLGVADAEVGGGGGVAVAKGQVERQARGDERPDSAKP